MNRYLQRSVVVKIGHDVGVELCGRGSEVLVSEDSPWKAFIDKGPASLSLEVMRNKLPELRSLEFIFDSKGLWKAYLCQDKYVFVMQDNLSEDPFSIASIDFKAGLGEIIVSKSEDPRMVAFDHPISVVVFSKLLADNHGFIAHACGVEHQGRGVLFVGTSGVGKSTLAELFNRYPEAHVLSDERVVVCLENDRASIIGTPWPGTAGLALPISVPLEQVFFLKQATRNNTKNMLKMQTVVGLVSSSFLPYWDRESSEQALATIDRMAGLVPMTELGFLPNQTAVEYVVHALGNS